MDPVAKESYLMFCRALAVALMVVSFWAAPSSAQTVGDPVGDYPPTVAPTILEPPAPPVPPGEEGDGKVGVAGVAEVSGGLARTGANNIGPLIQAAFVLLGAGTLLVLVARRRRLVRRAAAA